MNRKKSPATVRALVAAVAGGQTLRRAATAAGVHVATVCRWQAAAPALAARLRTAACVARRADLADRARRRPRVPWHPSCPACAAPVDVRRAHGCHAFWRCCRWPRCQWASWRPRHRLDCPACGGPRYWSHSRLSVSCSRCQTRISTH